MKAGFCGEYLGKKEVRMGMEKASQRESSLFVPFTYYIRMIKSRIVKWVGHVAIIEEGKSTFTILTGRPNPTRKIPLENAWCRLEDNARIILKK